MFINTDKIEEHRTLAKFPLVVKIRGMKSYSVHNVYLKQNDDELETQYFVFEYISGTAVMNWTKDDYERANNFLDISDTPIVMMDKYNNKNDYVNVSTDYRY